MSRRNGKRERGKAEMELKKERVQFNPSGLLKGEGSERSGREREGWVSNHGDDLSLDGS